MPDSNNINLPEIEETSLHRIATTVKLYQEFNDLGKEKFEDFYGKKDPKSLDRVCYKKYYKNKLENERFGLVCDAETGKVMELRYFLTVDLDENKNVTRIQSQNLFYWKGWKFEEDIEREDWNKGVENDKNGKDVGNFVPDKNEKNKNKPFTKYSFDLYFLGITFGSVNNGHKVNSYFEGLARFYRATFQDWASFSNTTFQDEADFTCTTFEYGANFANVLFKKDFYFVDIYLKEGDIRFLNDPEKKTDSSKQVLGKVFQYSLTIFINIAKAKKGAKLVMDYCDFTKLRSRDETLKKLRGLKDDSGNLVFIEGGNNTYHKYTYTQTFEHTNWNIQNLFKIIATKKSEYLNLITQGKVQVSFNSSPDKLEIIYSSGEDLDSNEWKGKVEFIANYMLSWFQDSVENPNTIVEIDKLNQFIAKDGAITKDFIFKTVENYEEFDLWQKEDYQKIFMCICTKSNFDSIVPFAEIINKLPMSEKYKVEITNSSDIQIGEKNTQTNNPTLEETAKFLEKMKPTKNKLILTFFSLTINAILGYFINQLPILNGFSDIMKYSITIFLVLLLGIITYFNS